MDRRPILGKGEYLVDSVRKKINTGPKKYPRTYEEGKELIINNLNNLKNEIPEIPKEKRMNEVIIGIKLSEGFLAKSYEPNSLFRQFEFKSVGTKYWETENKTKAKMNYVKIQPDLIDENINILLSDTNKTKSFKEDVCKVEEMFLVNETEIIKGFTTGWDTGRVELVLHPFDEIEELVNKLANIIGNNVEDLNIKQYDDGPTFVSAKLNREQLELIKDFNPLRIAKPLTFGLKSSETYEDKIINEKVIFEGPSTIGKIGLIDGGIIKNHTFLKGYTRQVHEVSSLNSSMFNDHGTKVAGVLMYGDLNSYETNEIPSSKFEIESIRVLPTNDPGDIDLYESIDLIEEVVPTLDDVNVFNISVGPHEPIDDDYISRFTYSLDRLAYKHKKLFVVAAGNDGDMESPYNRVQIPADIANGLSVGAYANDSNPARYSSVGYGREGCVIKPELSEVGGPMLLLSNEDYYLENKSGTSFSSPLIARKAAEIMARNNEFNYLTTRALLIHFADNGIDSINNRDGFGKSPEVLDILKSTNNNVTVVYNNRMSVSSHAKIRIPVPRNTNAQKFKITWTIVVESNPNPLNAESYTSCGIEDTFYPNENKFRFTLKEDEDSKKKTKTKHVINDTVEIEELLEQGYTKSEYPITKSATTFLTEEERRALLKWDTVTKKSISYTKKDTLDNPFIIVHAMSRDSKVDRVSYSVIVSIEAFDNKNLNYTEDLYEEIINEYEVLQPIDVSLENEINIQNN